MALQEDVLKKLSKKTEFERRVLMAVIEIPRGKVSTYKRIAEKIGRPKAFRAVGNALHKNPLAPIIPCHRVVRSNGQIVGETEEEVKRRRNLLIEENVPVEGFRVKLREDILY
ncbi:MAG: MGMT family protein [Candidatus Bathyarchaeota archaeon]|nr:MGMT family protein [Candidatus Bathyarchaeota archaeon]